MRYFITFAFDGTNYHGWQVQPNADTVQARMNDALSKLLGENIECVGAGRTDAGVHASKMIAHFDTQKDIDCLDFVFRLNRILPYDIAVKQVAKVEDNCHARFSAIKRTYHYFVFREKNPYRRHYAYRLMYDVDYSKMNEAAKYLLSVEDFTSFSKVNNDQKNNLCDVLTAQWTQVEDDLWRFEITANRFLRNMVRAIVGTLLEVGRGRMSIEEFKKVIQERDRCLAGESVAGNALFLVDVVY